MEGRRILSFPVSSSFVPIEKCLIPRGQLSRFGTFSLARRSGALAAAHASNQAPPSPLPSTGAGRDRRKSLRRAAVTKTGTTSRATSAPASNCSRSSFTSRALADLRKMPCVKGPFWKTCCSIAWRNKKQHWYHFPWTRRKKINL